MTPPTQTISKVKASLVLHPKELWKLVKLAAQSWVADAAPSMGAALAYYTVFSLAPLLLIVISIAGLVFGAEAARGEIFGQLRSLMGADAAQAIESLLVSVNKPAQSILATITGVVVLLIGATSVFGELQDALDRIWRAPAKPTSSGLWALIRSRLLSFGMIFGLAFLLMVSLVISAAMAALGTWWGGLLGGWEVLAEVINATAAFSLTTAIFAFIYKFMPRVKVAWRDVWLGAIVTALLFTVGKTLIGLYIGRSSASSAFGAAGSFIVVLIWVYYSSQVFLMGAEFTWVYANTFGSMRPAELSPQASASASLAELSAQADLNTTSALADSPERPKPLPGQIHTAAFSKGTHDD